MQRKGLKRNDIDKFYTAPNIASMCVDIFKSNVNPSIIDIIIEPSAGDGAFIPSIKKLTNHCKFYDLEPEHNDIIQQDFLDFEYNQFKKDYKKIAKEFRSMKRIWLGKGLDGLLDRRESEAKLIESC
jgi:hypothetical protein